VSEDLEEAHGSEGRGETNKLEAADAQSWNLEVVGVEEVHS
jgi:hypothetical protein